MSPGAGDPIRAQMEDTLRKLRQALITPGAWDAKNALWLINAALEARAEAERPEPECLHERARFMESDTGEVFKVCNDCLTMWETEPAP